LEGLKSSKNTAVYQIQGDDKNGCGIGFYMVKKYQMGKGRLK
jgi:hypothetical protein